jgi:hypothetical protein
MTTTSNLAQLLRGCTDPTMLMKAAGVEAPSPAIATALRAIYAAKPQPGDLARWRAISRAAWPTAKPRRVAAAIGRRGLKTSGLLAWAAVHELLCGDHDRHAAAGSRVYGVIVAPLVIQARESTRAVRAVLDSLAGLGVRYTMRDSAGAPELVITSPRSRCEHVIAVMTADSVSVRGFAIAFAGFDEAGFLPIGDAHATTDRDIVRSLSPGMVTFPRGLSLFVSSPGAPGSLFHSLIEKPTQGTLVIRAPTWVTNPRVTREMCLVEAGGDAGVFAQEYEASRFGYLAETFIDTRGLVVGSEHARGPREGSFVVGLDVAQLHDQTAIVVASSFEVEVARGHAPVRHLVAEHAEVIESSKRAPTPVAAIASRVVALSRAYGQAPVVHDPFMGPVVKAELARLGLREFVDPHGERVPPLGTFCQLSINPARQTPRWRTLRDLVHGQRLHLGPGQDQLLAQLSQLKATQLSSGALRVEGRRDDLADALALAAPIALKLPPTGGPAGVVEYVPGSIGWGRRGDRRERGAIHAGPPRRTTRARRDAAVGSVLRYLRGGDDRAGHPHAGDHRVGARATVRRAGLQRFDWRLLMAAIKVRVDRIVPVDCTPGAGYVSPEIDEMSDIALEIKGMPDDDTRPIVFDPFMMIVYWLMQCLRRLWQINDKQYKLLGSPMAKGALERSQADAVAAISPYQPSHQDFVGLQGSARAKILRGFQTDALKAAVEKLRPKLDEAADNCVDAFEKGVTAIEKANALFDRPTALQAGVGITDLQERMDIENEIEAKGPDAMTWVLEQLANAIKFQPNDLKNLIPAATRAANKWLSQPPGKNTRDRSRQAATHYSSHDPDDAWTRAQKVLRAIAGYRESQRPQSIAIAKTCLGPLFQTILGVQPDMNSLYHVDGNRGDKASEWEVDPTWPFRFAPPSPVALPGWSPIEIFTEGRIPIRKPNPFAADDAEPKPRANAEIKNLSGGRDGIIAALRGG